MFTSYSIIRYVFISVKCLKVNTVIIDSLWLLQIYRPY